MLAPRDDARTMIAFRYIWRSMCSKQFPRLMIRAQNEVDCRKFGGGPGNRRTYVCTLALRCRAPPASKVSLEQIACVLKVIGENMRLNRLCDWRGVGRDLMMRYWTFWTTSTRRAPINATCLYADLINTRCALPTVLNPMKQLVYSM